MKNFTDVEGAPQVHSFFDVATHTVSHIVVDPQTKHAALIDTVANYEPNSGSISYASADTLIAAVKERSLNVRWIMETHVHADHITAAPYLKKHLGGEIVVGKEIKTVQQVFQPIFNIPQQELEGVFDRMVENGEELELGSMSIRVMHTPGHTPADVTYLIGDAAFVGDTMFMPDYGTARTDFPAGSAEQLYDSIQKIFDLPENTRLFMGHDYLPEGREEYQWETTVKAEREGNIHVGGITKEAYVKMRKERDATLSMPQLIIPSIQVNVRGGNLPATAKNGIQYLNIPLNMIKSKKEV